MIKKYKKREKHKCKYEKQIIKEKKENTNSKLFGVKNIN